MSLLALLEASTAVGDGTLLQPRNTSQLFQAGNQAALLVDRVGTTGNLSVYGADLPDPGQQVSAWRGKGDGVTVAFTAPNVGINYAALSNNNFIVRVNGVISTDFTVLDADGGTTTTKAVKITMGSAPADGAALEFYKVSPTTIVAAAGNQILRKKVRCYDVMWCKNSADPSSAGTVALVGFFS